MGGCGRFEAVGCNSFLKVIRESGSEVRLQRKENIKLCAEGMGHRTKLFFLFLLKHIMRAGAATCVLSFSNLFS